MNLWYSGFLRHFELKKKLFYYKGTYPEYPKVFFVAITFNVPAESSGTIFKQTNVISVSEVSMKLNISGENKLSSNSSRKRLCRFSTKSLSAENNFKKYTHKEALLVLFWNLLRTTRKEVRDVGIFMEQKIFEI